MRPPQPVSVGLTYNNEERKYAGFARLSIQPLEACVHVGAAGRMPGRIVRLTQVLEVLAPPMIWLDAITDVGSVGEQDCVNTWGVWGFVVVEGGHTLRGGENTVFSYTRLWVVGCGGERVIAHTVTDRR